MILEVFQNGSDKVNRRLLLIELMIDVYLVVSLFLQTSLPTQDWVKAIPHHEVWLGVVLWLNSLTAATAKAIQMFFSKAAALYQKAKEDIHNGGTDFLTKPQTETKSNP